MKKKTIENVTRTGVQVPRDRSKVPIVGKPRKTPLGRLKEGLLFLSGAAIIAASPALFNEQYRQDVYDSLKYVGAKISDHTKYTLKRAERYTVQEEDNLWDIATNEVEGTYGQDYRGYHRENFIKHLIAKNIFSEGMRSDGTLVAGEEIKLEDLDGDGVLGH